ncbi:Energy transducer TonB, C-terminal region [Bradyrhizobium sp. ORS 278]|uniref:TonB family protein n=1 Tax=Bradyrhizobium sp. (strain ORS 278) TaxID=114615 RepID=UPI0001507DCA|nr:TonB family protein [Bradyrhizobium sp. ORS 278]CAL75784.1 Energy transducer TonB, C-terminal region [Bradyrhizobium sp. ORS 278]
MSVLALDPFDHEERRERTLWTIAAIAVGSLHVGLAVGYLLLRPAPQGRAQADAFDVVFTPAVVNEPAPIAQETPAESAPPTEPPKEEPAKDEPVAREAIAEPVPQVQPEPEPQVTAQPEAVPQAEPQVALAPEPPRADDVVPPPSPKPIEAKPPEPKPAPSPERVEHKPVEKKETKEKAERKPPPPKPVAAPASRPSRVALAPNAGEDSEGSREGQANWNSQVRASIARAASYPSDGNGASGTATVTVVIDRNGRLLSRRLAGSSGSPALDRAALSIVERAAPFPRFPPVMRQAQEALNVPLHLRQR